MIRTVTIRRFTFSLPLLLAGFVAHATAGQASNAQIPKLVVVVDMAPTLAAVVHVTPQEKLDGHVLNNAIR